MSKTVIVEITADRNFQFGEKLYGKGGLYEVNEDLARVLVDQGKAEVREGEISEKKVSAFDDHTSRQSFLNMVKECSYEILTILENESRRPPAAEDEEETATPETNEEEATGTEEANTENSPAAGEGETKGQPEKNEGTPIPEAFPGKNELNKAGIKNLEDIPQDREELRKIGINTRTANLIGSKLARG